MLRKFAVSGRWITVTSHLQIFTETAYYLEMIFCIITTQTMYSRRVYEMLEFILKGESCHEI
jgi:hypothetical protein